MHSFAEFGSNVPAFLAKLWKLVDDPETNELISWSEEGTSFCIRDQAQFSRKLLPMYYKHNNMASFIRQLNMYGFHKIVSADAGSLRLDKDEMEFAHQCFLRGHPYLLEHIKRKVGKSQMLTRKEIEEGKEGSNGGVVVKAEYMNKILSEVKQMRGRQETVEGRLNSMKQENEALWRELSLLRQKHIKQQTIVNKLIQFLVTLVQPSQRLSKRRYPLMINSVAHPNEKMNGKVTKMNSNDQQGHLIVSLRASQNHISPSPSGPTIHELDGDAILPDSDSELLSNTITLHVPDSGLSEAISSSLEPEVMSPDSEILDILDPSIIENSHIISPSPLPSMEVNSSEQEVLADVAPNTSSPSPDLLLAVSPRELNPAIVVPRLQGSKAKVTSLITSAKTVGRSGSGASASLPVTRPSLSRKSASNATKTSMSKSSAVPVKRVLSNEISVKAEAKESEPELTGRRELRVCPPRNKRKKSSLSTDSSPTSEFVPVESVLANPVDLLNEVGLVDVPITEPNASLSQSGSTVSISAVSSVEMSPVSNTTITDVTNPLIVCPTSNATAEQTSPQVSPNGGLTSSYDMTLACTSQAASPSTNTATMKSSAFNRDDLDSHVGSMDSELVQLKELLNNSGIQLDANTLLGLFSSDDSVHVSMPDVDGSTFNTKMDPTGNELMYYQPDFMDLEEFWNNENNRVANTPSPVDMLSEVNTPVMMPTSPGFSGPVVKKRRT